MKRDRLQAEESGPQRSERLRRLLGEEQARDEGPLEGQKVFASKQIILRIHSYAVTYRPRNSNRMGEPNSLAETRERSDALRWEQVSNN
jgi:hypothetical protein